MIFEVSINIIWKETYSNNSTCDMKGFKLLSSSFRSRKEGFCPFGSEDEGWSRCLDNQQRVWARPRKCLLLFWIVWCFSWCPQMDALETAFKNDWCRTADASIFYWFGSNSSRTRGYDSWNSLPVEDEGSFSLGSLVSWCWSCPSWPQVFLLASIPASSSKDGPVSSTLGTMVFTESCKF